MFNERRKHVRIATNVSVQFQKEDLDRKARKRLSGIAENCSLGGMYISTEDPFPEGSVLTLEFEVDSKDSEPATVTARAVVRWSRRWGSPKGMGLEFVEFEGPDNSNFAQWIAALAKNAMRSEQD